MSYCPDPTELIEAAAERQIRADGIACADCKAIVPWDDAHGMVAVSSSPDSAVVCEDCAMKIPEYVEWCALMDAQDAFDRGARLNRERNKSSAS